MGDPLTRRLVRDQIQFAKYQAPHPRPLHGAAARRLPGLHAAAAAAAAGLTAANTVPHPPPQQSQPPQTTRSPHGTVLPRAGTPYWLLTEIVLVVSSTKKTQAASFPAATRYIFPSAAGARLARAA